MLIFGELPQSPVSIWGFPHSPRSLVILDGSLGGEILANFSDIFKDSFFAHAIHIYGTYLGLVNYYVSADFTAIAS